MLRRVIVTVLAAVLGVAAPAFAQTPPPTTPPPTQNPPVPRPFPGAGTPPTTTSAKPAETPQAPQAPAAEPGSVEARLNGAPVYPAAEFLEEFDAGRGQRSFLFGTNLPFADILAYYRQVLRNNGREIFRAPAIQQFDLGRFDENTMAFPPSVVIKDYSSEASGGYLHVEGTTEKRFRTIIQIVPVR